MGWLLHSGRKVGSLLCAQFSSDELFSITSTEGQSPLFVSTDPTLSLACDDQNIYHLPQHLRHVLVIQRFLNRVNCSMTANTSNRGGRSSAYEAGMLLASLEDDLHQLEKQLGSDTTGSFYPRSANLAQVLTVAFQRSVTYGFPVPPFNSSRTTSSSQLIRPLESTVFSGLTIRRPD